VASEALAKAIASRIVRSSCGDGRFWIGAGAELSVVGFARGLLITIAMSDLQVGLTDRTEDERRRSDA